MSHRVPICGAFRNRCEETPAKKKYKPFRADLSEMWKAVKKPRIGRCHRVDMQAGERVGVAYASPARFTADGNADRIRLLYAFLPQNPQGL